MKWMEGKNSSERIKQAEDYAVSQFKAIYPSYIDKYGKLRFSLPDGSEFNVDPIFFGGEAGFVLSYFYNGVAGEDGDQYYPEDYDTPEAMFAEMLEETRR